MRANKKRSSEHQQITDDIVFLLITCSWQTKCNTRTPKPPFLEFWDSGTLSSFTYWKLLHRCAFSNALSCLQGFDRLMFRELLQNEFGITTEEILTDRIYCFFDRQNDGVIHEDEWITGLSVLLKGTQEERIKYTFTIYDLNGDGFITREEIFSLLRWVATRPAQFVSSL